MRWKSDQQRKLTIMWSIRDLFVCPQCGFVKSHSQEWLSWCCFGAFHKSALLGPADRSVMGFGGRISATILENRSVLSELTLSLRTENRQVLCEFFMEHGTFGEYLSSNSLWKEFSMTNFSYGWKPERKLEIFKPAAKIWKVYMQPEIVLFCQYVPTLNY